MGRVELDGDDEEMRMVDFRKLGQQAKNLVDKRGGTDALKQDASQLAEIAKGKGSLSDKAKAAAAALKDPGGEGTGTEPPADAPGREGGDGPGRGRGAV